MAIKRAGKTLTAREAGAYIRSLTGWTAEEYGKKLDVFRNRVRTYERATGAPRGTYNAQDIFNRDIRGQVIAQRMGVTYDRPNITQAILATPARSSGGRLTINPETGEITRTYISAEAQRRVNEQAIEKVKAQFHGLIEKSQIAQDAIKSLGENYTAAQLEEALRWAAKQSAATREAIATYNKSASIADRLYIDNSP